MKKMSDVFNLPVRASQLEVYGANSNPEIGFGEIEDAAAHAINMHDDLVTMLGRAREIIADDPSIGFRGIGLVVQIDKLLERCK